MGPRRPGKAENQRPDHWHVKRDDDSAQLGLTILSHLAANCVGTPLLVSHQFLTNEMQASVGL